MKQTSNNKLNYPGHIDCRNSSLTDKLEWESKSSVKWKAILRDARPAGSLLSIEALIKTPICWISKLTIDLIVHQIWYIFYHTFWHK